MGSDEKRYVMVMFKNGQRLDFDCPVEHLGVLSRPALWERDEIALPLDPLLPGEPWRGSVTLRAVEIAAIRIFDKSSADLQQMMAAMQQEAQLQQARQIVVPGLRQ